MLADLIDHCVDELQGAPAGVDRLVFDPIDAGLEEKDEVLFGDDLISGELGKDAKDMRPAE